MRKNLLLCGACLVAASAGAQWSKNLETNLVISDSDLPESANTVKSFLLPDGNMWVTWGQFEDNMNLCIKAQLVTPEGEFLLDEGGVYVSRHPTATYHTGYAAAVTPEGDLVVCLPDSRNDNERHAFDPYVYKIDKEGNHLWGLDGVLLPTTASYGGDPQMAVSPAGTVMVGYNDVATMMNFVLMKINADGTLAWDEPLMAPGGRGFLMDCGEDEFYLNVLQSGVKTYCIDSLGDTVWGPVNVTDGEVNGYTNYPGYPDGQGGIIVPYYYAVSLQITNNGLQRITPDGEAMFGLRGLDIMVNDGQNGRPAVAVNPKREEVLAYWTAAYEGGNEQYLKAQKFDYYGAPLWESPKTLRTNAHWGYNVSSGEILDNGDAIIIYWEATTSSIKGNLIVACLDSDGDFKWQSQLGPTSYCGEPAPLYAGEWAYLFWSDNREGNMSNPYGLVLGQAVNTTTGTADAPENSVSRLTADAPEGAVVYEAGELKVTTDVPATLDIYDMTGIKRASHLLDAGSNIVSPGVPAGVYVAVVAGNTVKFQVTDAL